MVVSIILQIYSDTCIWKHELSLITLSHIIGLKPHCTYSELILNKGAL